MSIIKAVFISASLTLAATAAQAQDLTTYIGGPKSGLTRTVRGPSAAIAPAHVRAYAPQVAVSGGANAIGVDNAASAYAAAAPVRVYRSVPARSHAASGGVVAIGSDEAN